ncbi:MAG: GatB/YqeY domain-containing protein [Prolixibacteraceae bacterium]|jgi:hypothetical protein|nr:GatB/YqeY domain-containing protein [Prolixibacteraceae bacterium]MDI9563891.1 GatB/YqeY domain-containing protein [Bacteroidota bacterium]NLS98451.1 GatB/YqeY domain-containing protein [Bacteroidales bacterium]OQB82272.1 MAG: Yqey-like protein [Bacteroidetes bacterium ADurb.Bin123]HNZ69463.1 GatB/YqeY domain-containing protein [Prolixibacteraceae bacterium]
MTLFDQVSQGIIEAMKAREKERLDALRNLKKSMLEARAAKGAGSELTDEESLRLISKLVKQGRDSAEIYKGQNRIDLYEQEMGQVKILEAFLPRQLTGEELTAVVKSIIAREGASSLREMGRIIGIATRELAGKAETREIAEKVKILLS